MADVFRGTVQLQTKQPAIYSFFSGPVLNNELFFANGIRLSIFVNQTIILYTFCLLKIVFKETLAEKYSSLLKESLCI